MYVDVSILQTNIIFLHMFVYGWYKADIYLFHINSSITKTHLFKYIENLTTKNWKFSDETKLIIFIFLLKT